jgi:hypothetical protein
MQTVQSGNQIDDDTIATDLNAIRKQKDIENNTDSLKLPELSSSR